MSRHQRRQIALGCDGFGWVGVPVSATGRGASIRDFPLGCVMAFRLAEAEVYVAGATEAEVYVAGSVASDVRPETTADGDEEEEDA